MNWQRARKPGQKAERVSSILSAAAVLFDEKELSGISMRDVADRAGLGKASLYHYFKTKEEVFISLYRAELEAWLPDAVQRLKRLRSPTPARVAKALTDALRDRQQFIRLTVVFSSILEHNLSIEFIREFKLALLESLGTFSEVISEVLPEFDEHRTKEFLFQHHAAIAGLWPLANPSPEVSQILEEESFASFRIDFFEVLESTLKRLLQP